MNIRHHHPILKTGLGRPNTQPTQIDERPLFDHRIITVFRIFIAVPKVKVPRPHQLLVAPMRTLHGMIPDASRRRESLIGIANCASPLGRGQDAHRAQLSPTDHGDSRDPWAKLAGEQLAPPPIVLCPGGSGPLIDIRELQRR